MPIPSVRLVSGLAGLSKTLSATPTLAKAKRVLLLPTHDGAPCVWPWATDSRGVSENSLRRNIPNPAGLIDIDERSAPSEVKAPPIPITRAVPNGCDRESAAKSVDIIRSLLYVSPPNSRFWACNGAAATQAASNIMILRFIHYLCFIVD